MRQSYQVFLCIGCSIIGYFAIMGAWFFIGFLSHKLDLGGNWFVRPAFILGPLAAAGIVISALMFSIKPFIVSTLVAMLSFLSIFYYDTNWEEALKERRLYAFQVKELTRAQQEADYFFLCGSGGGYIALTDGQKYFSLPLHNFQDKRFYVEYFPPIGKERGKVYQLGLYPGGFEEKEMPKHIQNKMNSCAKAGMTPWSVLNTLKPKQAPSI